MGNKNSNSSILKDRSKVIDKHLMIDAQVKSRELKILLLGAGDTGKSTFFKQMKLIKENDYTLSERLKFKSIILSNTVNALMAILTAMKELEIPFSNIKSISDSQKVFALAFTVDLTTETFIPELTNAMKNLWQDSDVQKCFLRSSEYQIDDTAK